jgi:hypothetical protein
MLVRSERSPRQVDRNRPSQGHAGQLMGRYQICGDDLAIVELQLRQAIQSQFKEIDPVFSPVPNALGLARGKQAICWYFQANFFAQLAPRGGFRCLARSHSTTREVPLLAIGRAKQQERSVDVDRHERPLMPGAPNAPPDTREGKAKTVCRAPSSIEEV